MTKSRKIIVVEQNTSGHRMHYVRLIIEEISRQNCQAVIVTSIKASDTPEWKVHLGNHQGMFEYIEAEHLNADGIHKLATKLKAEHVVIPDGDSICLEIGIKRKWPPRISLSLLIMRESVQRSSFLGKTKIKQRLKDRLLASADSLTNVNVFLLKSSLWTGPSTLRIVRDPVVLLDCSSNRTDVLSKYGLDPSRYWFGVLGAVTVRKNVPLIAEALSDIASKEVGLIVSGSISSEVLEQLTVFQEKIPEGGLSLVVHNELMEDIELDSLIKFIDCIVLAHSNEGPSGIMGKAAHAGTRVVAAGAKSLEQDCSAVPSLATWTELNVHDLGRALSDAVTLGRPHPIDGHTPRDFASILI